MDNGWVYQSGFRLKRDINPGTAGSNPSGFTLFNKLLWFAADDGEHGRELWSTDTQDTSSCLRRDINQGTGSSNPSNFIVRREQLWFAADDGTNGNELWVSDGPDTSARLWKDINPGSSSSNPSDFVIFKDELYFVADNGVNGRELWRNDGNIGSTQLHKDIAPGSTSSDPSDLTVFEDSQGNTSMYFAAFTEESGRELWMKNGTFQWATYPFADINPGPSSSNPTGFTKFEDQLYFAADDGDVGKELFTTDGTIEGTMLAQDSNVGPASSSPANFFEYDSKLLFAANDGNTGNELWALAVNGIATLKTKIAVGDASSNPANFAVSPRGSMVFSANDGEKYGNELYSSRGSSNVQFVSDINKQSSGGFSVGGTGGGSTMLGIGIAAMSAFAVMLSS